MRLSPPPFDRRPARPLAHPASSDPNRRGTIMVMAACSLILLLAFTAFAVDIGFISLTRSQLQGASDGAALAAGNELADALQNGTSNTQTATSARASASEIAAMYRAGDRSSVSLNTSSDVQLGNRYYDSATQSWQVNWGASPYNAVRVSARRDSSGADGALPLAFSPVIGVATASLHTDTTVALQPAAGWRLATGSTATVGVLPIAYDMSSWNSYKAGSLGSDNYKWNPPSSGSGSCGGGSSTGSVTSGSDGIPEFDIYPTASQGLPSGNRGTVDFGSSNNSTNDLKRQIQYGLNASDLSYFGGAIRVDQGPLTVNGDTGISAGIKSSLDAIVGRPRAIPLFTHVSGPGNNAMYRIEKFVGVRIMLVQLTGGSKKLLVQPATVIDPNVITSTSASVTESIYSPPRIVE